MCVRKGGIAPGISLTRCQEVLLTRRSRGHWLPAKIPSAPPVSVRPLCPSLAPRTQPVIFVREPPLGPHSGLDNSAEGGYLSVPLGGTTSP